MNIFVVAMGFACNRLKKLMTPVQEIKKL